jgi:hypothetical protein
VTLGIFHPGPGNRNGATTVSQADNQQLVRETYFTAIHNQTIFVVVNSILKKPGNRVL